MARVCIKISEVLTLSLPKLLNLICSNLGSLNYILFENMVERNYSNPFAIPVTAVIRCQTLAGGLLHAIVRTITLEARQLYFSMGFAGKNGGAEKTLGVH